MLNNFIVFASKPRLFCERWIGFAIFLDHGVYHEKIESSFFFLLLLFTAIMQLLVHTYHTAVTVSLAR